MDDDFAAIHWISSDLIGLSQKKKKKMKNIKAETDTKQGYLFLAIPHNTFLEIMGMSRSINDVGKAHARAVLRAAPLRSGERNFSW